MRVRIVCYEDADLWILGKMARRLHENLLLLGVRSDIAKTPDASADINHHIIYSYYDGLKSTTDTVMITHIDAAWKVDLVRRQLVNVEMGICMSTGTHRQLVREGLPRHKLCYINPAHDGGVRPRRRLIAITSKVQPTGCKRENMLMELASRISGDDFKFVIMGSGWSAIVESMRKLGIEVDYHNDFNESIYRPMLSQADYYLYLGQDEGSMGFLDALSLGIPTIVTPQGFHLDAIKGITYPFNELHELVNIFDEIAERKNHLPQTVETWTWPEYARKHVAVWDYLLRKKNAEPIPRAQRTELKSMRVAPSVPLSNLVASFYSGIHETSSRWLKIRRHLGEMVRYRLGRWLPGIRKRLMH